MNRRLFYARLNQDANALDTALQLLQCFSIMIPVGSLLNSSVLCPVKTCRSSNSDARLQLRQARHSAGVQETAGCSGQTEYG